MLIQTTESNPVPPGFSRSALIRSVAGSLMMILIALGCASVTTPAKPGPTGEATLKSDSAANGWWAARFKMNWTHGTSPAWHLDDLIAYEVVSPALEQHREQIILWRFHRRAAPDQGGHQFSFIFYATPQNAELIYASIRSNPTLVSLKTRGYVQQDAYQDTSTVTQPNIEDTADSRWSLPLKRSWPNFIMGVSEAWLILVSEYAGERTKTSQTASIQDLVAAYEKIHNAVEKTWQDEGGHALLHHLNALFGYVPVAVSADAHLMRF
jgi:hypothetical protein